MEQPKVIFLDAVGTLVGVKGSVGEVYGDIARKYGVEVPVSSLNQAFFLSFQAAEPMAFPGTAPDEIPAREFEWWLAIARRTFQQAGVFDQFLDFSSFFAELYAHFATPLPWFVYPDVLPALRYWQKKGIELGLVSNLDSRIYAIFQAFDLTQFFTTITISSEVGAAKPNTQIFRASLQKHQCQPGDAWHIGDSYKEDYQAAKSIGIRGIWLKREKGIN